MGIRNVHMHMYTRMYMRTCMYVARVMDLLGEKLLTPAVGDAPHTSLIKFRWPWLHYSEESNTACRCIIAYSEGKLQSVGGIESTYISKGYNNWKDAAVILSSHEVSVS